MNLMARLLLGAVLLPAVGSAKSVPAMGIFRFTDGGESTFHEVLRGDADAVETIVFTYGGSGCSDLGHHWLPRLANGMGIDARYLALNKRHVDKGAMGDGGGATCSADFNAYNTSRQWMADYMEFISRTLDAHPRRWKNIVLVGASEGGALAARVARARSDISHLVVVGDGGWSMRDNLASILGADEVEAAWKEIARHPASTERMWLGHPYRYWFDTLDHTPLGDYLALEMPVLIAFGERDRSVPVASGHEVLRAAQAAGKKNIGLVVYPGADHSLLAEEQDFLDEFLRGAAHGIRHGAIERSQP